MVVRVVVRWRRSQQPDGRHHTSIDHGSVMMAGHHNYTNTRVHLYTCDMSRRFATVAMHSARAGPQVSPNTTAVTPPVSELVVRDSRLAIVNNLACAIAAITAAFRGPSAVLRQHDPLSIVYLLVTVPARGAGVPRGRRGRDVRRPEAVRARSHVPVDTPRGVVKPCRSRGAGERIAGVSI